MFRVEDRVFVLACGVDDLGHEGLTLVHDLMTEGVLDGGVVGLDEVAFAVLDCEGGFADGAGADNGDFALFGMWWHFAGAAVGDGFGHEHWKMFERPQCRLSVPDPASR